MKKWEKESDRLKVVSIGNTAEGQALSMKHEAFNPRPVGRKKAHTAQEKDGSFLRLLLCGPAESSPAKKEFSSPETRK